jgi:UDP-N-acetylmuramyl pentapeptide phosphotransferase/UDP-N-acetylglucosamine-1-phosphate transferase
MPNFNFSFLEIFRVDFFIAGITSFLTSLALLLTKDWHGKLSMDESDGIQKLHTVPTPRIGGLGIVLGVIAGFAAASHDPQAMEKRAILSSIIIAGIPAFFFGFLEDLTKRVSIKARLLATMTSGVLGWGITGVALNHVNIIGIDWILAFTPIAVIFTAFSVGGVANAFNIIDGFNGLSSGVAIIMLASLGFIARHHGDIPLAFTCLLIAGAILGFTALNWPHGKIFLGDGGAYFIGFAIAWIALLLPHRNQAVSPWTSLLICAYPIVEVLYSFLRRYRREGQTPGEPDRMHLHHLIYRRIVKKYFPHTSHSLQNGLTAIFMWLIAAIPCAAALLIKDRQGYLIIAFLFFAFLYSHIYRLLAFFKIK